MSKLYVKNRYGQIPNEILNNPELSLKAKGLFGYLQAKPDGWKFSAARIAEQTKDRTNAIGSGLRELEKMGYLQRKPIKDKKGKWTGYDYILSEKPLVENPSTDNPSTENPLTENLVTLSKKDISKKDYSNKDISNATSVAGKEVNEIIDLFKQVNPSYEKFFRNKTQRGAVERLLEKFGQEKLTEIVNVLPITNSKKYAPTITTPVQLEDKLASLVAYTKKERSSKESIKVADLRK